MGEIEQKRGSGDECVSWGICKSSLIVPCGSLLPCIAHLLFVNNSICVHTGGPPTMRSTRSATFIQLLDSVNVVVFNGNGDILLEMNPEHLGWITSIQPQSLDPTSSSFSIQCLEHLCNVITITCLYNQQLSVSASIALISCLIKLS